MIKPLTEKAIKEANKKNPCALKICPKCGCDVYEQKMDNLREFLKEGGRADWIAKNAWYIKNHLIVYLLFPFLYILFALEIVIFVMLGIKYWIDSH